MSLKNIEASLILGSYLDTIGFNNGKYEFNFYNNKFDNYSDALSINYKIIMDFFYNGGFKNFKIKNKNASDDTILMIATGKAILNKPSFETYKKEYLKVLPLLNDETKRGTGYRTLNSLKNLSRSSNKDDIFKYQNNGGGNGAAMRSCVFGLKYRDDNDYITLINQSLLSAKMTHTHPFGYCGALIVAIFTKFAIKKYSPITWISKFINLIISDSKFTKWIINKHRYEKKEESNIEFFFTTLEKFSFKLKNIIHEDQNKINIFRNYNILMEEFEPAFSKKSLNFNNYGGTGLGVICVSLYILIISIKLKNPKLSYEYNNMIPNWEMIVLNILNFGDSDTIGIITGNWYGALFGYKNVKTDNLKDLEFYDDLIKLSKNLSKSS